VDLDAVLMHAARFPALHSLFALMSARIVMANFLEAIKSKWRLDIIHRAPSQCARSQMRHFNYCARLDGDVCSRISQGRRAQRQSKPTQAHNLTLLSLDSRLFNSRQTNKDSCAGHQCARGSRAFPAQVLAYLFIWMFVYLRVNKCE